MNFVTNMSGICVEVMARLCGVGVVFEIIQAP